MISPISKTITRMICTLLLGALFASCQDTIPNRTAIRSGSQNSGGTGGGSTGGSGGGETPTRPSGAITFKSDFCGCKDGKPVTYGNCTTFCNGKATNGREILYASFNVTEQISLGGFGSVYGWCTTIIDEEGANPKCYLETKDDQNTIKNQEATALPGTNSVTVDITDLSYDKTLVVTLFENNSKARSNSVQFIKFSTDVPLLTLGPLKNAPISQYSCIWRVAETDDSTGDNYWMGMYRQHFYFLPRLPPAPITPGTSNLICHDIFNPTYGSADDASYPRLELVQGAFNLWDTNDPRFYDNNGNGLTDINEVIVQKTKNFGATIPASTNFFTKFSWPGSPQLSEDAGNTNVNIGYYMYPWIDSNTFKSYCLTSTHYDSNNALFKALRDIIGVDTEGLYIAEKPAEAVTLSDGTIVAGEKDYILIRESEVKPVWFHLNNQVHTVPNDNTIKGDAVYFYYPINKNSPFVKTSTQRMYQVKGADELNNSNVSGTGSNSTGANTNYPPHDRKIGCIPKF